MSAKHTPGPWLIVKNKYGEISIHVPGDIGHFEIASEIGGEVFKDKDGRFTDTSRIEANAHLIAAAPELLTELKGLVNLLDVMGLLDDEVLDPARAAITKATGGDA